MNHLIVTENKDADTSVEPLWSVIDDDLNTSVSDTISCVGCNTATTFSPCDDDTVNAVLGFLKP